MRLASAILLVTAAAGLLLLRSERSRARAPARAGAVETQATPGREPTADERYAVVMRLRHDREGALAAIPELLEIVASGELGFQGSTEREHRLRRAALEALKNLGPAASPALPALLRWTEGDDDDLAAVAASLLGSLEKAAAPALPTILAILKDPKRRWARGADLTHVLENLGPEASAAAPFLLEMIRESAAATRKARERGDFCSWDGEHVAARALRAMGDQGIETLITCLGDPERDARWTAAWALAKTDAAVPRLLDSLAHADGNVREAAAMAIGASKAAGDAVREALVRSLEDQSVAVRREASKHVAGQGPLASPALVAALRDPDPWVRRNAALGLATFGAEGKDALPDLVRLLEDPVDDVRAAAARALGSMGGAGAEVAPLLAKALAEPDDYARERIAVSVGRMGAAAIPALVGALDSPDAKVRAAAARALRHAGELDAPTRLRLRDRLADGSAAVRVEAAAALAEPCALEILEAGLADADHRHREIAAEAIARMGAAAVGTLPALLEAERAREREFLEGKRDILSNSSAEALGKAILAVGAHDIPRLVAALEDRSEWVRSAALGALAKADFRIGPYFAAAGPLVRVQLVRAAADPLKAVADMAVVRKALSDRDARVRLAAAAAVWLHDKDARAALPVLVAALAEEETAEGAAFWIARIGKDAAFMEKELRRHAGSTNHMVSYYMEQALAAIEDDLATRR